MQSCQHLVDRFVQRILTEETLVKKYLHLLRIKHYIKNFLIFFPMFFGGSIFVPPKLLAASLGFLAFCLISSAVYILNDMRDYEKDRNHPVKCNRPLASGKISFKAASIALAVCLVLAFSVSLFIGNWPALLSLLLYLGLNVAYSIGLKNVPIIDVVILASGFVIRIFYGGFISGTEISEWLYLVITSGSLYLGLGKRRNELKRHIDTREVLKYYNDSFLDKNMYVCVARANVFYALWTIEMPDSGMIWTVPIFIVILMCYSLDVERDVEGDPTEIILHDRVLLCLVTLYAILLFVLLYIL